MIYANSLTNNTYLCSYSYSSNNSNNSLVYGSSFSVFVIKTWPATTLFNAYSNYVNCSYELAYNGSVTVLNRRYNNSSSVIETYSNGYVGYDIKHFNGNIYTIIANNGTVIVSIYKFINFATK